MYSGYLNGLGEQAGGQTKATEGVNMKPSEARELADKATKANAEKLRTATVLHAMAMIQHAAEAGQTPVYVAVPETVREVLWQDLKAMGYHVSYATDSLIVRWA